MDLLEIRNVRKTYRMGDSEVRALDGVSLRIGPGEFIAIMGASGSGKSTLLQVLGLLDTPDSGSYKLLGREVASLGEDELAAVRSRTLGFVFQQFNLLSRTSALENASLPLLYAAPGSPQDDPAKLLKEVGLGDRLGHKPNQLSGGQQQRVAIARALVNKPRIILADEPTGNLDTKSSAEILRLLEGLNRSGITVVMVTHEPDIARHAKRTLLMRDGKIVSDRGRGSSRGGAFPAGKTRPPARARLSLRQSRAYLRQAFRALAANKVRTALSILGILIGVAAVIAMLALGSGAKRAMEAQLSSLGTNLLILRPGSRNVGGVAQQAGSVSRLTLEDVQAIRASIPDVRAAAPESNGRAQVAFGNRNWNTQVVGTTPPYAEMRSYVPEYGRFFTDAEVRSRARVALVGTTVARELFGDASPLGEWIKVNRVNFQVLGVLPNKGASTWRDENDVVLVPVTTAMYRLFGKQYVDQINLEAVSADRTGPVSQAAVELMQKVHRTKDESSFQVRNMAEIQEALSATTRNMTLLLASIAAISLLVGGIGIMNIMLVSVTERTREIGLRKAVGAMRRDILSQFLIESVAVSLAGGILGILLGAGITLGISVLAGWATSVTAASVLLACGFSVVVGVAFGLWPAVKASKLSPILALRYE